MSSSPSKQAVSQHRASPGVAALVRLLRGGLVPAVLTPMRADGALSLPDLERYAARTADGSHRGIAVWAHTGRGPYLSDGQRATVLRTFRAATTAPIIAGVAPRQRVADADPAETMVRMARQAVDLGADAVMVFPPPQYGPTPDREGLLRALHERIADEIGAPMILFLLHAEAGGYPYSAALLNDLLCIPQVAGVKLATLDSAMTCQDVIRLIRKDFPDRLAITGEDRMFGPSLMWGADAALVGIAAAAAHISTRLLTAWFSDRTDFLAASHAADEFAYATFRAPMEGYVQRMLWAAEREGLISAESAHDPFGPPLSDTERARVHAAFDALAA